MCTSKYILTPLQETFHVTLFGTLFYITLRMSFNKHFFVSDHHNYNEATTITYYELELDWQMCSLQQR